VFAVAAAVIAQVILWAAHHWKYRRRMALLAVFVLVIANTLVVVSLADTGP
jgi:hypothetical protein